MTKEGRWQALGNLFGLSAISGLVALVIWLVWLGVYPEHAKFKQQREEERAAARAESEARHREKVKELPPTAEHPRGLVEFKLKARIYRIPKEFLYSRDGEKQVEILKVLWPSLQPLPDPIKERALQQDVITVALDTNNWEYHFPGDEKIEQSISRGRHAPVQLKHYPEIQEYRPKDPGYTTSWFRAVDPAVRRADGVQAYFRCAPVFEGDAPEAALPTQSCSFDLGWPDGVTMDLDFPRKRFKDWKVIHDRVIAWFESFRVLDVPTERLYPSYKDGKIEVPPVERKAFRLE